MNVFAWKYKRNDDLTINDAPQSIEHMKEKLWSIVRNIETDIGMRIERPKDQDYLIVTVLSKLSEDMLFKEVNKRVQSFTWIKRPGKEDVISDTNYLLEKYMRYTVE